MKKIVAFALVLVMVLTLCATAFAAKPTMTLKGNKHKTVTRGKTYSYKFELNCGSYKKKGTQYRAEYVWGRFDPKGNPFIYRDYYFTGKATKTWKVKFDKSLYTGKYTMVYGTLYLSGKKWKVAKESTYVYKVK